MRALLGCSQRDVLVADVQRQAVSAYAPLPAEIAVASLRLSYPDIEGTEWASIRTFVDSYRMIVPQVNVVYQRVVTWSGSDCIAGVIAFWQAILRLPLFLSYLLLAILAGGLGAIWGRASTRSQPGAP